MYQSTTAVPGTYYDSENLSGYTGTEQAVTTERFLLIHYLDAIFPNAIKLNLTVHLTNSDILLCF